MGRRGKKGAEERMRGEEIRGEERTEEERNGQERSGEEEEKGREEKFGLTLTLFFNSLDCFIWVSVYHPSILSM